MYNKNGIKLLRVDLSTRSIETEILSDEFYRLYPGGRALAGYYLLTEMSAHVDPFDPESLLVVANGLLTGSPIPTTARYIVAARSPLTNAIGSSEAGGYWGPELKKAGFEAIIVTGRADTPVYLWINDDNVEILPAQMLWGKQAAEVQEMIREEQNDKRIQVLQIGVAGENLVRYSGLSNDLRHFNGRNGMGAVMGSKNLKAIAVRGSRRFDDIAHDPEGLRMLGRQLVMQSRESPISRALLEKGTPGSVEAINNAGMLPTYNFRRGSFEQVEMIKWESYQKEIYLGKHTCYGCPIQCKRKVQIDGEASKYGGPEYESIAAFSSNCGISDLNVMAKANELCNAYLLDTISAGTTIAFAMECYEKGLIDINDTNGVELKFGNADAILPMIEMIVKREGFGGILAEGSKRAAEIIGKGAIDFAQQVKGQELPMHEPRGKYNVGLGFAFSEIGADHLIVAHDNTLTDKNSEQFINAKMLGFKFAQPARSFSDEKLNQYFILENWYSFENVVGYCFFGPAPRGFIKANDVLDSINLATGWELTLNDLSTIGERSVNLFRLFNIREGFSTIDDDLPKRFFDKLESGYLEGAYINREEFLSARNKLYKMKGWDPNSGIPTRSRLDDLGLGWAADLLMIN